MELCPFLPISGHMTQTGAYESFSGTSMHDGGVGFTSCVNEVSLERTCLKMEQTQGKVRETEGLSDII